MTLSADWLKSALPLVPAAVFALALLAEQFAPRRPLRAPVWNRWLGNGAIYLANTLLVSAAGAAAGIAARSFETAPATPMFWLSMLGGVLVIDLTLYALHRLQHAVPLLWRFHAVHHADNDVDCTTAVRHHPGDFLFGYAAASLIAAGLGIPAVAIAAYGALALSLQILQHANLDPLGRSDALWRRAIATPAMHRVHHSPDADPGNSNFGVLFSLWDRMFGTYREPAARAAEVFGVRGLDDARYQRLDWMLITPLRLGPESMQPRRG